MKTIEEIFAPLRGNDALKNFLSSSVKVGKLSHAYIIEGAKGSGKFTLATMLSAAISPSASEKVLNGECVDVTVYALPEDKKSIGISTVRELKYQTQIQPQELPHRIFIIRDAQTMTPEAQNSLLKVLEEPPAGVYIFLLCESASALLPTVRSRAPSLRMQYFSEDELGRMLSEINKKAKELSERSPEEYSILLRASEGTVGGALSRLEQKKDTASALRGKALTLVEYLRDGKRNDLLLFFASQSLTRDDMSALLRYLSDAARDMLAAKKCGGFKTLFYHSAEAAEEDAYNFASESLMKLYTVSERMAEELSINPNMTVFSIKCACELSDAVI